MNSIENSSLEDCEQIPLTIQPQHSEDTSADPVHPEPAPPAADHPVCCVPPIVCQCKIGTCSLSWLSSTARCGASREGLQCCGVLLAKGLAQWQVYCYRVLVWAAACYCVLALLLFLLAPILIYPGAFVPSTRPSSSTGEQFFFQSRQGHELSAYRERHGTGAKNASMIFLGGNGQTMWGATEFGATLAGPDLNRHSYDVYSFSYRGFSPNKGGPWPYGDMVEEVMIQDALGLWDAVRNRVGDGHPVVLAGWSLGTAVASGLAAALNEHRNGAACLMLVAPFTSLGEEVAAVSFHLSAPWKYVVVDSWQTERRVAAVRVPVAVLSSGSDEVIPSWMHRQVYDAATEARSRILIQTGAATHAQLSRQVAAHTEELKQFLETCITSN